MPVAVPQVAELMLEALNKIALINEDLEDAMRRFHRPTDYRPEPAACAPLAVALKLRPTLDGRLYLVTTGTNIDDGLRHRIIH